MTRHLYLVVTALFIVSSVGCAGRNMPEDEPVIGKVTENELLKALDAAEVLQAHEAMLPENTVIVAVIDLAYFLDEIMADGFGMLPEGWDSSQMSTDIGELSVSRLGVDINDAGQILVAITDDMKAVALIEGDLKMAEGLEKVPHDTVKLFKPKEEGLYLADTGKEGVYAMYFDMEHVDMLADVQSGEVPSLKDSAKRKRLHEALEFAGPGIFSVAIQTGEGELSKMLLSELPMPIDAGAFVVSETLTLVIQARPEVLDALEEAFNAGTDSIKQELAGAMTELDDEDFIGAFITIAAYHIFVGIDEALEPLVEGEVLAIRVGMPTLNSMMPMMMAFGVGAMPFFMLQGEGEMPMMGVEEVEPDDLEEGDEGGEVTEPVEEEPIESVEPDDE